MNANGWICCLSRAPGVAVCRCNYYRDVWSCNVNWTYYDEYTSRYHKHKLWSPCLRTNFEAAALACSSRGCAVTIYYISAKCGKCPLPWKFTGGQPFKIRCMILRWDVGIVIAHARRMTSGFRNSCYTSSLTLASTYILTQLSPDLKRGYFTKFTGLRPSFCDKKRCRGPAVPDCTEIGSFVLKCSVHI